MRCQANCLAQDVQVPGSTRAGPGESGRAVAQTHADTEHPRAAPSVTCCVLRAASTAAPSYNIVNSLA